MGTHVVPHCFKEPGVVFRKDILSQRELIWQQQPQSRLQEPRGKVTEVGELWGKMRGMRITKAGESVVEYLKKRKGKQQEYSP